MAKNYIGILLIACLLWAFAACGKTYDQNPPVTPDEGENIVTEAPAAKAAPIRGDSLEEPLIVILKSERTLELYSKNLLVESYRAALGREPNGDKQKEGDGRTPEGLYYICTRNDQSRYYLSLGISYPNKEDAAEALENGTIDKETYNRIAEAADIQSKPPWNTPMGGEIMIHGMGSQKDWTMGCIAVENDVMDILWQCCPLGTPVIIKP